MANAHPEETFDALMKTDGQLKSQVDVGKYRKLPSDAEIEKAKAALEAKNMKVHVVKDGASALEWLKTNIPAGKTVGNSHSTTLEEIGFVEHLKTQKAWVNLHEKIFQESDASKRGALYNQMHAADYYFSSATAITTTGEIVSLIPC
jgi:hypothetical protein